MKSVEKECAMVMLIITIAIGLIAQYIGKESSVANYTKDATVTEVVAEREVHCIDREGLCWSFYVDETNRLVEGDKIQLVLKNSTSDSSTHNEIINYYYQ